MCTESSGWRMYHPASKIGNKKGSAADIFPIKNLEKKLVLFLILELAGNWLEQKKYFKTKINWWPGGH